MAKITASSPETSTNPEIPLYNLKDFMKIENGLLGTGSAASVYLMSHHHFGNVAVKSYSRAVKIWEDREVRILIKNSKHPNIVQIYGQLEDEFYPGHSCGYIMEYMERCSLHKVLYKTPEDCSRPLILSWIVQAGRGLDYLHRSNVLHRDIKPQNMLLGPIERLKLSDFDVSREFDKNPKNLITAGIGTYCYMAPETFQPSKNNDHCVYDERADVYSLAISIWEMFCQKIPYSHLSKVESNNFGLQSAVIEGHRPDCLDLNLVSEKEIKNILERGWHEDPQSRPKIQEFITLAERLGAASSGSNLEDGPYSFSPDLRKMESLSLQETLPGNFELIPINDRSGLKQDILRRYFSHLTAGDFPMAREKLLEFENLCERREKAKEDPQSIEMSILILGPVSEESRVHLEAWIRRQAIVEGFHLFEISLAAGDIFIFTYRPREKPQKGQLARDKENRACLSYFTSFPTDLTHIPYPRAHLMNELGQGKIVNILFAGDNRTNAENFVKKAVVTYLQEKLQREMGNKADALPYTLSLNGLRYQFNVTRKGDNSMGERISKERQELSKVDAICILVNVDAGEQKDVAMALDTVENIILVGYSETLSTDEGVSDKFWKAFHAEGGDQAFYLKRRWIFQISKKFMDFYNRKLNIAERQDNLFCANRKEKMLDEKKVAAKVKVIDACLTAVRNASI